MSRFGFSSYDQRPQIIVHDHDVLSGRGVNIAHHPGNQRFRTLVTTRADESYCAHYSASEKRAVAEEIIKHIKSLDPPGRFLRREGRGQVSRGLAGPWEELSERESVKKACQALRDCNRLDREGYANGVAPPEDVVVSAQKLQETGLSGKQQAARAAAEAAAANAAATIPNNKRDWGRVSPSVENAAEWLKKQRTDDTGTPITATVTPSTSGTGELMNGEHGTLSYDSSALGVPPPYDPALAQYQQPYAPPAQYDHASSAPPLIYVPAPGLTYTPASAYAPGPAHSEGYGRNTTGSVQGHHQPMTPAPPYHQGPAHGNYAQPSGEAPASNAANHNPEPVQIHQSVPPYAIAPMGMNHPISYAGSQMPDQAPTYTHIPAPGHTGTFAQPPAPGQATSNARDQAPGNGTASTQGYTLNNAGNAYTQHPTSSQGSNDGSMMYRHSQHSPTMYQQFPPAYQHPHQHPHQQHTGVYQAAPAPALYSHQNGEPSNHTPVSLQYQRSNETHASGYAPSPGYSHSSAAYQSHFSGGAGYQPQHQNQTSAQTSADPVPIAPSGSERHFVSNTEYQPIAPAPQTHHDPQSFSPHLTDTTYEHGDLLAHSSGADLLICAASHSAPSASEAQALVDAAVNAAAKWEDGEALGLP